jgi:hypothetical protein
MVSSSQAIASDGVQHRRAQEGKTDGNKENVEHGPSQFGDWALS